MPLRAGLGWAYTMLLLQLVEWVALVHILFMDIPSDLVPREPGFLEVYFALATGSLVCQGVGTGLVLGRWYRTGGALQLLSCLIHLPKGEGIIGLVGGMKAFGYAKRSDTESRT